MQSRRSVEKKRRRLNEIAHTKARAFSLISWAFSRSPSFCFFLFFYNFFLEGPGGAFNEQSLRGNDPRRSGLSNSAERVWREPNEKNWGKEVEFARSCWRTYWPSGSPERAFCLFAALAKEKARPKGKTFIKRWLRRSGTALSSKDLFAESK